MLPKKTEKVSLPKSVMILRFFTKIMLKFLHIFCTFKYFYIIFSIKKGRSHIENALVNDSCNCN